MFKEEKIFIIKINEPRSVKLEVEGQVVGLIFISRDEIIIRGDLECSESKILPPSIKNF